MAKVHRTIKVQYDKGETREETLLGRDYLVVPVVAMVEGVRYGANQSNPELGLASEFGDTPIAWANRPLVLNHPQVEGEYVSANTPDILESYQFGLTMNPQVKNGKLLMEAWIDVARVEELGGEFEETYERIVNQEEVEISVGFFSTVDSTKGKFKGQAYSGIWRNIKPDHLAILSEGVLGACSVADGCGIPRINSSLHAQTYLHGQVSPDEAEQGVQPMAGKTKIKTDPTTQSSCGCGCGGTCGSEPHAHEHADDDAAVTVNESEDEIQVTINKTKRKGTSVPSIQSTTPLTFEQEEAEKRTSIRTHNQTIVAEHLKIHEVDPEMLSNDVSKLVGLAIRKKFGSYSYLYGYNNSYAIFETYDYNAGGYSTKRIGINVTEGKCEFVGEPEEVILQTKIVSQGDANDVNTQTQENDMSNQTPTTQSEGVAPAVPAAVEPAPVVQSEQKPASKLTAQEYIEQAPDDVREVLESSMRMHAEKKASLIKTLKDSKQCRFDDTYLQAQKLDVLENMVALLPGTYAGVAAPTNISVQEKDSGTVPAPRVFELKKPGEAA